ncbi:hypothetical protein [Streptomyces sp. LN590]|uniref:hypothetical protein n=1 Tax=Streptomyces sp. LN590 TaxID=3112980 RepID=UPI00371B8C7A
MRGPAAASRNHGCARSWAGICTADHRPSSSRSSPGFHLSAAPRSSVTAHASVAETAARSAMCTWPGGPT